ncbi:UNVERIFIED_CONTAM: hypothetical protein Sangu_2071500 [Sesamum angustifolium]|uniref:Uncharacterized protein n=1 Tax=Sesamum angustifolium TaxID=2727405 RepID=A0AAW2LK64_9LAMI
MYWFCGGFYWDQASLLRVIGVVQLGIITLRPYIPRLLRTLQTLELSEMEIQMILKLRRRPRVPPTQVLGDGGRGL